MVLRTLHVARFQTLGGVEAHVPKNRTSTRQNIDKKAKISYIFMFLSQKKTWKERDHDEKGARKLQQLFYYTQIFTFHFCAFRPPRILNNF